MNQDAFREIVVKGVDDRVGGGRGSYSITRVVKGLATTGPRNYMMCMTMVRKRSGGHIVLRTYISNDRYTSCGTSRVLERRGQPSIGVAMSEAMNQDGLIWNDVKEVDPALYGRQS